MDALQKRLEIPASQLEAINQVLLDPHSRVMKDFLDLVVKYGTPEEINRKHKESRKLENLYKLVQERAPAYIKNLDWLIDQRNRGAFISIADYRKQILGEKAAVA
jgi:hypothetical protein